MSRHRPTEEPFRWKGVSVHAYKEEDDEHFFAGITRQTLFDGEDADPCELRYFEIEPGGYSSLERHEHVHQVIVLRGRGRVLVDPEVTEIGAHDAIRVPSGTWHQFYASEDELLGFLCMVEADRDRPDYPNSEQIEELCARIDTVPPPLKRATVRS